MADLIPRYSELSLAVKYTSVLFPFDVVQFVKTLSKHAYIVPEQIQQFFPVTLDARVEVSGIVGRKGEVSVRVDEGRQVLAIHAPDPKTALAEMESTESLLKNEFDVDSTGLAQYYEFFAQLAIKAKKSPLQSWHAHSELVPMVKGFSDVLGTEVSLFGLRLALARQVPNQANWFDIRIEPLLRSPTTHHLVGVVFRRARRDETFEFVAKFGEILPRLVSMVD